MRNKTVIITGASSGIGECIAQDLFSTDRYHIINVARKETEFAHSNIVADLSDEEQLLKASSAILNDIQGEPFYLINNAGALILEPETIHVYSRTMDTNLKPAYHLSRMFASSLTGGIINMSSVSGVKPLKKENIAYSIAKAGIIILTKCLATEYPKLSINSISPGFIEPTNLVPGDTPQSLIDLVPMGREGNITEISNLVCYLMHKGRYITGQNIIMDGGLTL